MGNFTLTQDQMTVAKAVGFVAKKSIIPALESVMIEWGEGWMRFTATDSYILGRRTFGDDSTDKTGSVCIPVSEFSLAMTPVEKLTVATQFVLNDEESALIKNGAFQFEMSHDKRQMPNIERLVPFGEFDKHREYEGGLPVLNAAKLSALIASIGPARVVKSQVMRFARIKSESCPWLVLVESQTFGRFEGGIMEVKV